MKDRSHPMVEVVKGDLPAVLSVPHAGKKIPEEMRRFAVETTPGDRDADLLAHGIIDEARRRGASLSCVIARGRRALLELNWGESRTRGIPELKDYYWAYMESIRGILYDARREYGGAVLLDVHGYAEGRHKAVPEIAFEPGDIVFGTWNGELVPEGLRIALEAFKTRVRKAGFPVHPPRGGEEYWRFIGGDIVGRFGGRNGVAAVQMEVPSRIRLDPAMRDRLARALAAGLTEFAASIAPPSSLR